MTEMKKYKCVSCLHVFETMNYPEICPECEFDDIDGFVEIPNDVKTEQSVETPVETPVKDAKTDSIGFRASPTIMKRMIEAISIPLSSKKSYFNKIVFQKDEEKIVSTMTANGNTFLTVAQFNNEYFKNSWGFGNVAINSNKALEIINYLRHYEFMNFHHSLDSKILLFHIGEKDRMSMLAEDIDSVSGYNPNIYAKIDKTSLIMPIAQDENSVHFDVATGTLNHLVERASSPEESIVFSLDAEGVKVGVGDVDNPVEMSYALDIEAINYKPPAKPYTLTIGAPFFNVLKIVDGLVHFCFFGEDKPMCIVNTIKNDDDELIGKTSYTFSPHIEG